MVLFGVYRFDFIMPAEEKLMIYSCVWDFILGREEVFSTTEVFYSDVVNLASRSNRRYFYLSSSSTPETIVVTVHVAGQVLIEMALAGKETGHSLGALIREQREQRQRAVSGEETSYELVEFDPSVELEIIDSGITDASTLLAHLRREIERAHKGVAHLMEEQEGL